MQKGVRLIDADKKVAFLNPAQATRVVTHVYDVPVHLYTFVPIGLHEAIGQEAHKRVPPRGLQLLLVLHNACGGLLT
jgi:hypothetical protein